MASEPFLFFCHRALALGRRIGLLLCGTGLWTLDYSFISCMVQKRELGIVLGDHETAG